MRINELFYEVWHQKLPESFDGFKILHISDLHSEMPKELLEIAKKYSPDIIALTGDLINGEKCPKDAVFSYVKSLSEIAPLYFVSGNHDKKSGYFMSLFEENTDARIHYIDEKMKSIEKSGERIDIFGIGDPFSKRPEEARKRLVAELDKITESDGFSVLLYHRASHFDIIKDKGFSLVLSGHMHGGQIIIPHFGGLLPPRSSFFDTGRIFFPKYTGGEYAHKDTKMIVSRGIGNQIIIPRINNRPEVSVITLKKPAC